MRAGVTENPVRLTHSVRDALTRVTCGGAPVYVWPGGGITFMVDVSRMPENAFGYVPTPALVAPIEFTLKLDGLRGARRIHGTRAPARVRSWTKKDADDVSARPGQSLAVWRRQIAEVERK